MSTPENDVVDSIVRGWSSVRSDIDATPLEVFSRVKRISKQLDLLRRACFAKAGLEPSEFDVLSALRRSDAPLGLTPKQLLASNLVSSGTMTNRIDRLVRRGLVTREHDPADGRSILVQITAQGTEMVDEAITLLLNEEEALLGGLDPDDVQALSRGLRVLALHMGQTEMEQ
ncbi:MarR family winged helix-turn-helix transcriptional regulator [Gulosibacter chungangensis]|uniref:MarR family transcriptional regulator n=1 Tax=Gulosibacter chungangensis TaxID=979746 RepID=A0A7J5BDD3_9MICO|nr:MarR family transcriptional regulator [Gulosibacter chungangensis]KAB1643237.1 MarR family transcriptional regulator [Gulosibacter chungangensis]